MNENNEFNSYYDYENATSEGYSQKREALEANVLAQSFLFMFVALIITGITAFVTLSGNLIWAIVYSPTLFYGLLIAEIVVVLIANYTVAHNMLVPSAILFVAYSVINGMTLSIYFLVYTGASIVSIFFLSAIIFGVMAAIGITTKKDLSGIGNMCLMGLIGIILVSLANILFLHMEGIEVAVCFIGVLLFVGITAYDTQKIKNLSYTANSDNATVLALYGALELYLDFINIFIKLLRILGNRRN